MGLRWGHPSGSVASGVAAVVHCGAMTSNPAAPPSTTAPSTADATVRHCVIDSPVGPLLALERAGRIVRLEFLRDRAPEPEPEWVEAEEPFAALREQLTEYFEGGRRSFDLPIEPEGTEFQQQVWSALQDVPYGRTVTYGEIAEAVGRPTAVRAVGGANNANRIPIIIPCHRVVGADGSLTGFGGGLEAKALLLELEAATVAAPAG